MSEVKVEYSSPSNLLQSVWDEEMKWKTLLIQQTTPIDPLLYDPVDIRDTRGSDVRIDWKVALFIDF